jgi:hypothetical protein
MHLRIPSSTTDLNSANVKLAAALAAANGKATAHTATLRDLALAAEDAEAQLAALGLPPSRRRGAEACHVSGGNVPSSYKYRRRATYSTLRRGTDSWFLVLCTSADVWPSVKAGTSICIPAEADEYLVAKLRDRYSVIRPTAPVSVILDDLIPIPEDVQASVMRQFFAV